MPDFYLDKLYFKAYHPFRSSLKEYICKVTHHDPCLLDRYSGLYEAPRKVIAAVAGSGLIEMERRCRDAWCCGAGCSVRLGNRAYALETARERLDKAVQTGADVLITACPLCIENFSDAKQEYSIPLELIDIAELVARSIA